MPKRPRKRKQPSSKRAQIRESIGAVLGLKGNHFAYLTLWSPKMVLWAVSRNFRGGSPAEQP